MVMAMRCLNLSVLEVDVDVAELSIGLISAFFRFHLRMFQHSTGKLARDIAPDFSDHQFETICLFPD